MNLRRNLTDMAARLKETGLVGKSLKETSGCNREFPVQCDEYGLSLRQQAFKFFGEGLSPSQVYREKLPQAKPRTILRYYEDWKKIRHGMSYKQFREIMKANPDFNLRMIDRLADALGIAPREVLERMQRPWGLLQMLRGKKKDPRLKEAPSLIERRLEAMVSLLALAEFFMHDPRSFADAWAKLLFLTPGITLTATKEGDKIVVTTRKTE
jgi:hypothetical protein